MIYQSVVQPRVRIAGDKVFGVAAEPAADVLTLTLNADLIRGLRGGSTVL